MTDQTAQTKARYNEALYQLAFDFYRGHVGEDMTTPLTALAQEFDLPVATVRRDVLRKYAAHFVI